MFVNGHQSVLEWMEINWMCVKCKSQRTCFSETRPRGCSGFLVECFYCAAAAAKEIMHTCRNKGQMTEIICACVCVWKWRWRGDPHQEQQNESFI